MVLNGADCSISNYPRFLGRTVNLTSSWFRTSSYYSLSTLTHSCRLNARKHMRADTQSHQVDIHCQDMSRNTTHLLDVDTSRQLTPKYQ